MIERRLVDSDAEVSVALLMHAELERGTNPEEARAKLEPAWEEIRRKMEADPRWWRPGMIGDDALKTLCHDLDRTSKDLFFEALGVHSGYTAETFLHNAGRRLARIDELKSLIRAAIEDAGWQSPATHDKETIR
jgi:hypothetical protein